MRQRLSSPAGRRAVLAASLLGAALVAGPSLAGCGPKEQPPATPPSLPPMPPPPANQGGASAARYRNMMKQGSKAPPVPENVGKP